MYSSDENPGLQKQIGCMNGILQLFDRRNGGFAGRRIAGHGHKRLPSGQRGQHKTEHKSASQEGTLQDISLKKGGVKEKQRTSTESSGASFSSSSCSSTFSSVDSHIATQAEPSSSTQCISPRTPSRGLPGIQKPKPSFCSGQQSPDFRDFVKDSMYKEARGLSVRIMTKEATAGHGMKHTDSPRPSLSKSVKLRVTGSNESPRRFNGEDDRPRLLTPKDRPRFSYDGRETKEKSAVKLRELPRLSLDSKEASRRCSTTELKSKCLSSNLRREIEESLTNNTNLQQEPGSNKRPSNLVAKLMGVEDFPGTMSIEEGQLCPIKTFIDRKSHKSSRSSRTTDEGKQNQVAGSPRNFFENPTSPCSRNTCSAAKSIPNSKFPLETAPWRQQGRWEGSQVRASRCQDPQIESNSPKTVYGEIEKRLTEIQFRKSGKDLRAHKHILEAMQNAKDLEAKKQDLASQVPSQRVNKFPNSSSPDQSPRLFNRQNPKNDHPTPARVKGTSPPKRIMIMKPNKATNKSGIPASTVVAVGLPGLHKLQTGDSAISGKDLADKQATKNRSPRNNHFQDPSSRLFHSMDNGTSATALRSTQASKESQHSTKEETTSSRSSGTTSPRLQQHARLENHAHPTTLSHEVSTTRRLSSKGQGSNSRGRKLHPKPSSWQQSKDELSKLTNGANSFNNQRDRDSLQPNLASQIEVTCTAQLNNINGTFHLGDQKHDNTEAKLNKDGKMAVPVAIQEQPSPVSVLGATFSEDDSPSPVKKISNTFQDDETLSSDETHNLSDRKCLPQNADLVLSSIIHYKSLELREDMIQKLRKLSYADEEPKINCIAPIGKNTNLDHGYIYEIFSASSLLHKDLAPNLRALQPHSSGHTINPNLFFVLEQTKGSSGLPSGSRMVNWTKLNEKVHRKLVFDTVDEILVGKLALACTSELWSSQRKLPRRNPWGQQLLNEVCSEIDRLQANSGSSFSHEDEALKGIKWEDSAYQIDLQTEVSNIVLDVERLIFKDLVAEIVKGEATSLKDRPGGPCRQLFPK